MKGNVGARGDQADEAFAAALKPSGVLVENAVALRVFLSDFSEAVVNELPNGRDPVGDLLTSQDFDLGPGSQWRTFQDGLPAGQYGHPQQSFRSTS